MLEYQVNDGLELKGELAHYWVLGYG